MTNDHYNRVVAELRQSGSSDDADVLQRTIEEMRLARDAQEAIVRNQAASVRALEIDDWRDAAYAGSASCHIVRLLNPSIGARIDAGFSTKGF